MSAAPDLILRVPPDARKDAEALLAHPGPQLDVYLRSLPRKSMAAVLRYALTRGLEGLVVEAQPSAP